VSEAARTPIAVTKTTYAKLHRRAQRDGIPISELIGRLIDVALDEEVRYS
jgi:hypothetical protein